MTLGSAETDRLPLERSEHEARSLAVTGRSREHTVEILPIACSTS